MVLAAPLAHAQSEKDADAERLFTEAKKLMEEKKFAEACPKLESAYRKDQQGGTLLNLAYCHQEMGSKWLAWTEYREAESKGGDSKRKDFAHEKMKELEKGLTRIVIDDPTKKYELTEFTLEEKRIYDAEKGLPFYAEPNNQRKAIFHAKGKKPAILLISVGSPKDKMQHIQVPDMVDEDPIPPTPPPETPTIAPPPPAAGDKGSSWSTQKTIAVAVGVVGVVGVAVGGIFGLKTMGSGCNDDGVGNNCTRADRDSASSDGSLSTIGLIAGGALLAGAAVLYFTAPSQPNANANAKTGALFSPTITAKVGPTWAGVGGTF